MSAAKSAELSIVKLRPWLDVRFARSSGPGGQNVNKVATQVAVLLDFESCTLFSWGQRRNIRMRWAKRLAHDGRLRVTRRRERSQARNRRLAEAALLGLLFEAFQEKKIRISTSPTRAAERKRLRDKRRRSQTKSLRCDVSE